MHLGFFVGSKTFALGSLLQEEDHFCKRAK